MVLIIYCHTYVLIIKETNAMKSQLIIYPEFDARIERDYMYTVSVTQGVDTQVLPVYNHTEDSRVNRNPVDGKRADEYRRFCTFAFTGERVRVDIRVNRDFDCYSVIPAAKGFEHEFSNGVISVYLDKPDYFAVRLDKSDSTLLAVCADEPETEIPEAGENVYIIDGWHEVNGGVWEIREPNTTVYIKAGAVLNARVHIFADNCKILGRGAIVDPVGDIYRYDASKYPNHVVLLVRGANNTLIDGIHMLDSKAFNIEFIGIWEKSWAVGNTVRNTKILCSQMQTDGITMCYYSRDSHAEHCFVYCGDNALVYEEYAHYEDITIGTTCNALFPQTDVVNSSAKDIYVFRADEGIINCEYCGEDGITRIENHTIKNLYATDVTYTPYFLYTEIPEYNPVVTGDGGLLVENVYIPKLSETHTPMFHRNIAAGDYEITLKNLSIGGKAINTLTSESVGGELDCGGHTFCYELDEDFDASVPSNLRTVSYKNDLNVLVGNCQVYFSKPILRMEDEILLPYADTVRELRAGELSCVQIDGEKYVKANTLVADGAAVKVTHTDNILQIIPVYCGENLLLADKGIVSKFTEYICYDSHMVVLCEDGDTVYRIINTNNNSAVGIFRLLDEDIKKYGEGKYMLCFEARAAKGGLLKAVIDYSLDCAEEGLYGLCGEWRKCALEFCVSSARLCEPKIAMIICCGAEALDEFDVKNISFTKIN